MAGTGSGLQARGGPPVASTEPLGISTKPIIEGDAQCLAEERDAEHGGNGWVHRHVMIVARVGPISRISSE